MTEEERKESALNQIQNFRGKPIRRLSNTLVIFQCFEGKNSWYCLYNSRLKKIERELDESTANYHLGDEVEFVEQDETSEVAVKYKGKIQAIVPPKMYIATKFAQLKSMGFDLTYIANITRYKHQTSYLIVVGNKELHWPDVSKIRKGLGTGGLHIC